MRRESLPPVKPALFVAPGAARAIRMEVTISARGCFEHRLRRTRVVDLGSPWLARRILQAHGTRVVDVDDRAFGDHRDPLEPGLTPHGVDAVDKPANTRRVAASGGPVLRGKQARSEGSPRRHDHDVTPMADVDEPDPERVGRDRADARSVK